MSGSRRFGQRPLAASTSRPGEMAPWIRRNGGQSNNPYYKGQDQSEAPKCGATALLVPGAAGRARLGQLGQFHGIRELLQAELRLRIPLDQVAARLFDAEERHVDVVVDHRQNE